MDSAEGGQIAGRIYSQWLSEPMRFSDLGNLVLQMDEIMDARNYPQAYQRSRTFLARKNKVGETDGGKRGRESPPGKWKAARGKLGAFSVAVFSRRSSCWQGMVDGWTETPGRSLKAFLFFSVRWTSDSPENNAV